MDNASTVHGDSRHDAFLHEIDQDRCQADLDHMGTDAGDHRPASAMSLGDRACHGAKAFHRQNVRESAIECAEAATAAPGSGEVAQTHLAVAFLEWMGF